MSLNTPETNEAIKTAAATASPETTAQNKTKKPKKKHLIRKIVLGFFCCILALLLIALGLMGVTGQVAVQKKLKQADSYKTLQYEKQLVPQKDAKGYWCFTTDQPFKVLQITDVHMGLGALSSEKDQKALNAVATMVSREKPDLVIFTGDESYSFPWTAGTINNKNAARVLAELMEKLGVYWTIVYGNHDTEAVDLFSRETITKFYMKNHPHCLLTPGPSTADGCGNQVIEVKNSLGVITQAFVGIDSHSYIRSDSLGAKQAYDNIHENQVAWYKTEIGRMNAENKAVLDKTDAKALPADKSAYETVKTLAFFHIPLRAYLDAWTQLEKNNFKDTADTQYVTGMCGEVGKRVYCGVGSDDLFETMLSLGSTKALFCGHDHLNNFTVKYKGIYLSYGYSIDYLAYPNIDHEGSQRGCTLITVSPDTTFTINKYNYYSDRYKMDGFECEPDVVMQFKDTKYEAPLAS